MRELIKTLKCKSNFGWAVFGLLLAFVPLGSFLNQILDLGKEFSGIAGQIPLVIMGLGIGLFLMTYNLWKFVKANEPGKI